VQTLIYPISDGNLTASTRYALQLLTPAAIVSAIAGRTEITLEDINEVGELFLDAKSSAINIGTFNGGQR
jgi:RuvB-like protein 1